MLTRGAFFHVDYAMLLGKEPHLKSLVGNTMRITPQGLSRGTKSSYYAAFQTVVDLREGKGAHFPCTRA